MMVGDMLTFAFLRTQFYGWLGCVVGWNNWQGNRIRTTNKQSLKLSYVIEKQEKRRFLHENTNDSRLIPC